MGVYRVYDFKIKSLIAKTKNPRLFPDLDIPRSTAMTWIRKGVRDVVTLESLDADKLQLIQQVSRLERELAAARTKNELVVFTFRIFGLQIQYQRLPSAEAKTSVIERIRAASAFLPLMECLDAIGLSAARYHSWIKRQVRCLLTDQSSCPKLTTTQLTPTETAIIRDFVTSKDYVHFSIPSLAWFARRERQVFASLSSWYRVIAEHGLRRPLQRIYPPKPKVGVRASAPNQIWHLDQTLIRLENGTRIYLQAIIDNLSRLVLAWSAATDYGALRTRSLLERAVTFASDFYPDMLPCVITDSGSENLNGEVDTLIDGGLIHRIIAQIEVDFSNSMVESFFRSVKHRWLYLIALTTFTAAHNAIEKYIADFNHRMPLHALSGGTPFEVWSGKWTETEKNLLLAAQVSARSNRITRNRTVSCGLCPV